MARDTIAAAIIAATIIGNEEARSDPGFFLVRMRSDKQLRYRQNNQAGEGEIHKAEYPPVFSRSPVR
jgi:hypothetical protein